MLIWHGSVIDGMTVRARIVLALRAQRAGSDSRRRRWRPAAIRR
jgi:hypothetical protein